MLLIAAGPKAAAQTIRKVYDIGWRPLTYLTNVSLSVGAVMQPAGPEKGVGIITSGYLKEQGDPAWAEDAGMNEFRRFLKRWLPDADPADSNTVYGYGVCLTMMQVLRAVRRRFLAPVGDAAGGQPGRAGTAGVAAGDQGADQRDQLPPHPQHATATLGWPSWQRFGGIIEGAES